MQAWLLCFDTARMSQCITVWSARGDTGQEAEGQQTCSDPAPSFVSRLLAAVRLRVLAAAPGLEPWLRERPQTSTWEASPRLPPIAWHPSTPRLAAASTSGRVHIYEVLHGSGGAQLQEQKVLAHKDQRQVCLRGSNIVVWVLRDPPAALV